MFISYFKGDRLMGRYKKPKCDCGAVFDDSDYEIHLEVYR